MEDKSKDSDNVGLGKVPSILEKQIHLCQSGTKDQFQLDENGAVSGVTTFEDLLEMINPKGRWTIMMIITCCACKILLPFQLITYEFVGATPEHYWCHVQELTDANWTEQQIIDLAIPVDSEDDYERRCNYFDYNYTKAVELGYEAAVSDRNLISISNGTVACSSRDYNTTDSSSTLVTEFDLVCDRRALYSTTQASSQFGILLGALIFGYLIDKFGRRPMVLLSIVFSLICGLGAAIAPVFSLYVVFKILVSGFNVGYYNGVFLYMIEICSPSQRSAVGSMAGIPWSVGYMIVPGIAYIIRPWRWLQVAYTLPMLLLFSYYWLLSESPRWLISQGRYEEAAKILAQAAHKNGRSFPQQDAVVKSMRKMNTQKKQHPEEDLVLTIWRNLKHFLILIIKPQYRRKILISYFCWCIVSLVYYGISLNSGNLSTDKYVYVFLGGLAEIPAYFLMWLMLSFLGRRVTLMIYYFICGLTIAVIAIILATLGEVPFGLLIFLSLTGKICITAAFLVNYVITVELFPTRYRSIALGESSMMARVGSIMSPYINDLLGASVTWGPSALFASVSCVAGALCLLQPETKDFISEDESRPIKDGIRHPERRGTPNEAFEDTKLPEKRGTSNEAFEIS